MPKLERIKRNVGKSCPFLSESIMDIAPSLGSLIYFTDIFSVVPYFQLVEYGKASGLVLPRNARFGSIKFC